MLMTIINSTSSLQLISILKLDSIHIGTPPFFKISLIWDFSRQRIYTVHLAGHTCTPLLNGYFLHATITILHDVQALGGSRQSLTIHGIANDFLDIGRGRGLVFTSRIILHYFSKVAPTVSKPIILICALGHVQCTFTYI